MSTRTRDDARPLADVSTPFPLQRPSLVSAVWLHATLWLRRLLVPRQAAGLAVLALVVVAVVVALARQSPGDVGAVLQGLLSIGAPSIALVALGLGIGAIRRDADAGALDALMLRPHAAIALPLGRLLATALVVATFGYVVAVSCGIGDAWLGHVWPLARIALLAVALPLGACAYAAVFVAIGAWFRAAAAISLVWWLVVDLGLSRFVDGAARIAVRPAFSTLLEFDTDVAILGRFEGDAVLFWLALLQLLALVGAGAAATWWRMRGDVPD